MDGAEPYVILGTAQSRAVRASRVDGFSDMAPLLCGSLWGRAQERNIGHCKISGVLSGKKMSPGTVPDARHFSFSLHVIDGLQAAAPMLEARGSESELVLSLLQAL